MRASSTPDTAKAAPTHTSEGTGKRLLGEILVEKHGLSDSVLADALLRQRVSGKRLGALLVEVGALDERDLAEALGEHFGLAVVDLRDSSPEPDAIARMSETEARSLVVLPLRSTHDGLEIAVADPSDDLSQELRRITGVPVTMVVASGSDIRRALNRSYRALSAVGGYVDAFTTASAGRRQDNSSALNAPDAGPVVHVVDLVIAQAVRDRASDIHIEPLEDVLRVRYRIDGVLHDVLSLPAAMGNAVISRVKVLAHMNIVERRRAQDGQIAMTLEGRALDIRVSSTGTVGGEKVVMRLLDKSRPQFKLAQLGMPADTYAIFTEIVHSPFGMVVCAGPTGSGKTTSLYATMSELNGSERNIMTIEDPVEYVVPSINQIQINEQAGITFASGLRSVLRQDPDVILVGEMRDTETVRIAVQSALTGHFVLSSIHATDAASALTRLLDMGIEPFVVSSSVLAVLSQRLVRRICDQCREPYDPTDEELSFFVESGGRSGPDGFFAGRGCTFCVGTGYSDRIGVYELLRMTPQMKRLVATSPVYDDLRELAIAQGMQTLRQEAVRLVAEGITTIAEVIRSIYVL